MADIEHIIRELRSREAIRDVLFRYCRAVDRADQALLHSCYWPDAIDDHGPADGPVANFFDWVARFLPRLERGIHELHNILIELGDGDATVETYFSAYQRQTGADGTLEQLSMKGRYLDRLVERDGEWRILKRLVVFDWVETMPPPEGSEEARFGPRRRIGGRWPDDPVYHLKG